MSKPTIATVRVPIGLTIDDVETVIIGTFEGRANYWINYVGLINYKMP